ncbi:alanine--tRNA ligase [Prochlorococcus sp. MIT 1223]|uniref:alanine--tRNA ligase n=1 Tax=Prochlorococcus sp. MIT 1223 TaxID=3096217 RepID=UPI002A747F27|nr:alanine--tRNA ligase [Prochlorococcus sp. MIT 1223]
MTAKQKSKSNLSRSWSGDEIRSTFIDFFAGKGHKIIPSASLVPDDPTVLLTIAGMLPFKPVFLGKEPRPSARGTSSQKCIRTNDIENVGRTARHHTFFEMLGNFSFGDYFKKEAIQWAWELCTNIYGLNPRNLVVSVFREDDEAESIWRDLVGVTPKRIIRMDEQDNFWSSGPTGPCGPCSEIYYDFKPDLGNIDIDLEDDDRFIEFYNLVFMEFNRDKAGKLTPLEKRNIDTGLGLERMAQILQGVPNNYETDLIFPLIEVLNKLFNVNYHKLDETKQTSLKILGDHSRAVIHLIADGVTASNLGRGYILRRLIRRMVRHGRLLGNKQNFLAELGNATINLMKQPYPNLVGKRNLILSELKIEELRFLETLDRGEKLLDQIIASNTSLITGNQAFELYDTYGFPLELTQEIAEENDLSVDIKGFDDAMDQQRKRAKDAAVKIDLTAQGAIEKIALNLKKTNFLGYEALESQSSVLSIIFDGQVADSVTVGDKVKIILDRTPFYGESGGQIGDTGSLIRDDLKVNISNVTRVQNIFVHSAEIIHGTLAIKDRVTAIVNSFTRSAATANHTATHLLQSALKSVIDSNIGQRGSLVAFDRLRFDFNAPLAINNRQLREMETLVNKWIIEDHPIAIEYMPIDEALQEGALAMFGEKYGDIVRVVDVPGVSKELCGGTHVTSTSELGVFKIISESGIASGIRRIEAVAGPSALSYLNDRDLIVKELSELFKSQPHQIIHRVSALQDEIKELKINLKTTKEELAMSRVLALKKHVTSIGNSQYIIEQLDGIDATSLQSAALKLLNELGDNTAVILGGLPDLDNPDKVTLIVAFGLNLVRKGLNAGKFIGPIARDCGGGGGGRPNIAQAGGRDAKSLSLALDNARQNLIALFE